MYAANYSNSRIQYLPVPDQITDPEKTPPKEKIISPPKPEIVPDEDSGDGMEYPVVRKRYDKKPKRQWDTPPHMVNIDETLN